MNETTISTEECLECNDKDCTGKRLQKRGVKRIDCPRLKEDEDNN